MATYQDMQSRIADETLRTDLPNEIAQAIQTAIAVYQPERFYGNEQRVVGAFNTTKGQELYTTTDWDQIPYLLDIDRVTVTISTNRYTMNRRTPQYMEDVSVNDLWQAQPIDFSYYQQSIRLYPVPDATYPVTVMATAMVAAPVNPTDSNFWTTDAEQLIRSRAKLELALHVLRDPEMAQSMQAAVNDALSTLKKRTARMAHARIRPSQW